MAMKKLILLLAVFLLLSTLHIVEAIPEVTVKEGKPIIVTVTAKNTGTKRQEDWLVGIDFYKVTDYTLVNVGNSSPYSEGAIVDGSGVRVKMDRGKGGGGGIGCFHDDGRIIPNFDYDCYTSLTTYLDPGQSVSVTCEISPSFWLSKWSLMTGNERIMVWVHETIDAADLDSSGSYEWWWDALARKAPAGIIINTVKGPVGVIDVNYDKILCDQKGLFTVTVKNTGHEVLYREKLKIIDELKPAGERHEWNGSDIPSDIPVEGSVTLRQYQTGVVLDKSSWYLHNLTLVYDGSVIYNSPEYTPFLCVEPKKLEVEAIIEPALPELDEEVHVWVYDESGSLIAEHAIPNKTPSKVIFSLHPGKYSIQVSPSLDSDQGRRHFSHIWDHDCNGAGGFLDSADNPYVFTMYEKDKSITVIYKGFTSIPFDYNGTHIFGKLNDERGYGVLEKWGGRAVPCGENNPTPQNVYVDLYYEKDGKWYPIGKALTSYTLRTPTWVDRDGSFSYEWHCIPGVTRLKAVYNPYGWNYEAKSEEIERSCDLDITEVKVCDDDFCTRSCRAECSKGNCVVRDGNCPSFECGKDIIVKVTVKNKGTFSQVAEVMTEYWEVSEKDGSKSKGVKKSESVYLGTHDPIDTHTFTFHEPASSFADMEEGKHLGFWVYLKGMISDTSYSIDFPTVEDPIKIDNSKFYSVSQYPHMNFWCDMRGEQYGLVNCTVIYTHDKGENGKVHLQWLTDKKYVYANYDESSCTGCIGVVEDKDEYYAPDGKKYGYAEVNVTNGATFKISLSAMEKGILEVHARVRDWSKDEYPEQCDYSRDPTSICINEENGKRISCPTETRTIDIKEPGKSPDLFINDIFSYDSLLGYEIANRGSSGAFPSKTSLTIDGSFITTNDVGFLLPGDVQQYAFTGVTNWRNSYCEKNPDGSIKSTDTVDVKVCADHLNDVEEGDKEGNNCKEEKNLPCCTPTSSVEICNDGIDNNCDNSIDCADSDCVGATSGLTTCCQQNADCPATDSDGGIDEFTRGTCNSFTCQDNKECSLPSSIDDDECIGDFTVKEYYPDPTNPNQCTYININCPEGYGCKDGKCILTPCQGDITLALIPNRINPSGQVTPLASGLKFCEGKTVNFGLDSCTGKGSCTIGSDGHDCTASSFSAPSAGIYTYYACINKNLEIDSDTDDFGEKASATLEVIAPPTPVYILSISPAFPPIELTSPKTWDIDATDSSVNPATDPISYVISSSVSEGCSGSVNPTVFSINNKQTRTNVFSVTVTRSGDSPCTLSLSVYAAPDGSKVAEGSYKVCANENDYATCTDGKDNNCDGYVDCEDSDCRGIAGCCRSHADCSSLNNCVDTCDFDSYPDCKYGGGYVKQDISTCDLASHTCSVKTKTFTDTYDGNVDNPTVTYYECVGIDAVDYSHQEHDICDANTQAENWYWDSGENKLKSTETSTFSKECTGKVDSTYSHVRETVCNASDGTVEDTIVEKLTDCGKESGKCFCYDGSCQSCGSNEYCDDNYKCIPSVEYCNGLCSSIWPWPENYFFESRCSVTRPYPWFMNSKKSCDGGKFCFCYWKCTPYMIGSDDYQCLNTNTFCIPGLIHKYFGTTPFLLPFRETNGDNREEFKICNPDNPYCVLEGDYSGLEVIVIPGSGYELYVKVGKEGTESDICPIHDDDTTYDCKGSDIGGKKVCTINLLSSQIARIAVYNISATTKYNITIKHPSIPSAATLAEIIVPIEVTTTTTVPTTTILPTITTVPIEVTTTTTVPTTTILPTITTVPIEVTTTTTVPVWRRVQLGFTQFLQRLLGLQS
jgi:hypothetical protein